MEHWTHYKNNLGVNLEKFHKATIFESGRMLLGINSLEPKQQQAPHQHEDQDKFYFVVEGSGLFQVGDEQRRVDSGGVVIAPAGVEHGVRNEGEQSLILLVGIAPWISPPSHSSQG